jgi:hypothetical protein
MSVTLAEYEKNKILDIFDTVLPFIKKEHPEFTEADQVSMAISKTALIVGAGGVAVCPLLIRQKLIEYGRKVIF